MSYASRCTLRALLETANLAIDPRVFALERILDTRRPPQPVRYEADMGAAESQLPCNAALNVPGELRPESVGIHVVWGERNAVSLTSEKVKDTYISVKNNVRILSRAERLATIAAKLKDLRKERRLGQAALAELCGVSRVQVSRWEHALDLPAAKALLKLADLFPESERQWWRDQASEQAGFALQSSPEIRPFTAPVAQRTIPLVTNHKRVGSMGSLGAADVEQNLYFPANWFPEGGIIRAVTLSDVSISPIMKQGCTVLIDITRRDPDRLVGCTVAVQAAEGIDLCMLHKDANTYLLIPLHDGVVRATRVLRHEGENSILGEALMGFGKFPREGRRRKTRS